MAHDVFISYARKDKGTADKLCRALEAESIRCWIAPRDATLGKDYEKSIMDAIKASPFLVLVFSRHSNASPHVVREIQKAFKDDSSTEVFPFRLEDTPYNETLDYYLGSRQWVDAWSQPLESSIARLVEHLRAHPRLPDGRLPADPAEVASLPARRPNPPLALAVIAGALVITALAAAYWLSGSGNPVSNNSVGALNGNENSVEVNSDVGNANDAANDNRNSSPPLTPTPTPERNPPTPTPQATPTPDSTRVPRVEEPAPPKTPRDIRIEELVEQALSGIQGLSIANISCKAGVVTVTGTIRAANEEDFGKLRDVAEIKAADVSDGNRVILKITRAKSAR